MDFESRYTPEQEQFRQEVREWLEENVPRDIVHPADPADLTWEQYQMRRDLGRKLGARGWLWPTAPAEFGGGGLDVDHSVVIEEEIDAYGLTIPPYYDSGGRLGGASIMVWGTQEQKEFFLPQIFTGAVRTWQLLSEPEAGSDLANVKTQAVREGGEYVINGQKIFVGSGLGCDYMWTITVTDPEAKRHENLGWFMIPADLPGITVQPMDLLISGGSPGQAPGSRIRCSSTTCAFRPSTSSEEENQGWKVATTHLELEHGTGGRIARNWLVDRLFEHCRSTTRRGAPMTKDPDVRDRLIDVYIEAEIVRLLNLRNYWMRHSGADITYEGPQASYLRKTAGLRMAGAMLDILGPSGLTFDEELGAEEGHMEAHARAGIVAIHPGGTTDIQKVIMARRIGIGREVRERAGALS